ncbi:MAG: tRNA uridine-5-carboxymethylaminomethyl(34) synthesis GTPase MnmE, partial [Mesorhizobium sp.]
LLLLLQDIANPRNIGSLPTEAPALRVGTKLDLLEDRAASDAAADSDLVISVKNGAGVDELLAEIGRRAAGRIVGAIDVEDMLDVIFSQFCIGK